ncbi:MAG: hypothetical protein GXY86_07855 [Firmicutes bacterium]|nr:hypothetical protein [Bacillota bacterium]
MMRIENRLNATHPAQISANSCNNLAPLSTEAFNNWLFRKEGLESLVLVGFLTLFAEITFGINIKAERVAGGRVSLVWAAYLFVLVKSSRIFKSFCLSNGKSF